MRLMYLRVKGDCSLFKDIEICFNPEWRFTIDHDVINCQRYEEFSVPQNFYSTGSDTPVEAVNVIVGKNGSGKTTVARVLKEIFSGDMTDFEYTLICRGTHPLVSGGKENDQTEDARKEMWLICSFDKNKKRGVNYKCADIELGDKYVLKLQDLNCIPFPPKEFVDLVYYSPHFTTENPFRGTSGRMVNLSTTGLFVENPLSNYNRIQLASGVDSDVSLGAYAYDERRRIIEFASAYYGLDAEQREAVPFPMPILASLDADGESIDRLRRYFHDKAAYFKTEKEALQANEFDAAYNELERMCERVRSIIDYAKSNYLAITIIVGYVAAYCADCNLLGSYKDGRFLAEYGVGLIDICSGDIENLLSEEGKEQDRVVLEYFCRALMGLRKKFLGSDYGERERSALKFFLRLRKLVKRCPPQYNGIDHRLVVEIANDVSFRILQDVVKWHRLSMVFSTFIKIDFEPKLSSGEVSYLTLYGRLASHFIFGNSIAASDKPKKDVVVFVDEAETTLHPLWQKALLWNILWFFENFAKGFRIHLMLATHSPMLLSDVPLWHDIILKRRGEGCDAYSVCCGIEGNKSDIGLTNTFAANIFDLYRCPFFMENGTMGAFAASKVNALLQKFRLPGEKDVRHIEPDELKDDLKLAMLIGDPFISRLIWRRLDALVEDDGDSNFGKELNQMRDGNEKN